MALAIMARVEFAIHNGGVTLRSVVALGRVGIEFDATDCDRLAGKGNGTGDMVRRPAAPQATAEKRTNRNRATYGIKITKRRRAAVLPS